MTENEKYFGLEIGLKNSIDRKELENLIHESEKYNFEFRKGNIIGVYDTSSKVDMNIILDNHDRVNIMSFNTEQVNIEKIKQSVKKMGDKIKNKFGVESVLQLS